jgi:hypothetical protein
MKTGMQKTGLQSAWALALSLGVLLAAQAQPADSTGAGRAISAQGTISSSSGTTGTYTPPPPQVTYTPPAPTPQSRSNISWTMYFKNTSKCDWASCAHIDGSGQISWAPRGGGTSYGPKFPVGSGTVEIGQYGGCGPTVYHSPHNYSVPWVNYSVTATPSIDPSTGNYQGWSQSGGYTNSGCEPSYGI